METITSAGNTRIRHVRELLDKARTRRKENAFVIEGVRIVADAPIAAILELFVTEEALLLPPVGAKVRAAQEAGIPVIQVTPELMERMADTKTPQGVLAVCRIPSYTEEELLTGRKTGAGVQAPLLLILENLQDPGNLGTIFRTAEAAGVTGILMNRGTVDLTNPKTVRATMSAVFREPFCVTDDLAASIAKLRQSGIRTYAAALDADMDYDAPDLTAPAAFLIGNEGNGLTPETQALADCRVRIPMEGRIESLNAAMAAGILAYEAYRQRRK